MARAERREAGLGLGGPSSPAADRVPVQDPGRAPQGPGDTAPHPRYTDVIRAIANGDGMALTGALQEAERNGSLAEYLAALQGCAQRAHPSLTEEDWPLDNIWSAFSDFAEAVPALTVPPRDQPNRWLAKFISGPYLHRLGALRRFLKPNVEILREWIAGGRFALAGHLLEVQM